MSSNNHIEHTCINNHNKKYSKANELSYWLNSSGSLTAMLEEKAGQSLRVERIFEGYRCLTLEQKKHFGIIGQSLNRPLMAWVREVLLYGNDSKPWVAATSVFPITSLKGAAKRLRHLKGTPIGYVLFKRQAKLANRRSIHILEQGPQRQTLYTWHGRPLLISETFLAAFEKKL